MKSYAGSVSKYCVHEEEMLKLPQPADLCGAKTNNLLAVRALLPDHILTPASSVIPFNSLKRTMDDGANAAIRARFEAALSSLPKDHAMIGSALTDIQEALAQLSDPQGMQSDVVAAMKKCVGSDAQVRVFVWRERDR